MPPFHLRLSSGWKRIALKQERLGRIIFITSRNIFKTPSALRVSCRSVRTVEYDEHATILHSQHLKGAQTVEHASFQRAQRVVGKEPV